jgi:Lar family restriction alleviation protein
MSNTLLPCPFCGGEGIVVKTERCGRYIVCWDCGGRTEEFETDYAGSARDKAVDAWNRRYHIREVTKKVPASGRWEIAIGYDPNKKVQCQNCYKMAH